MGYINNASSDCHVMVQMKSCAEIATGADRSQVSGALGGCSREQAVVPEIQSRKKVFGHPDSAEA